MKTTYQFLPSEWDRFKGDLEILRLCPTTPVEVNVKLSRMFKKIMKALAGLGIVVNRRRQEIIEEIRKAQEVDDVQKINWTPEDQQKLEMLNTEFFGSPLALELNIVTSADFPNLLAPNGMGVRNFLKEDRSGRVHPGETHFLDHYLNLLGELILDLDDKDSETVEEAAPPSLSVVE